MSTCAAPIRSAFEHVLVDEFQDTNRVQYELVKLLGRAPKQRLRRWR